MDGESVHRHYHLCIQHRAARADPIYRRTQKKEISIRKVLGASVANIVFLLNKEFMILVGIALVIASPIAFLGMRRWLQDFAYRVTLSWWIFVLAGLITLAISLLTISLRVVRAALVKPTDNLRSE
ncbi:ABC transporter permease [Puia sp. P3]|uniref:ABC transporter permease n=1 Tax=Puia sp. P3 TaxID=3423952 RepID=UPI003D66B102